MHQLIQILHYINDPTNATPTISDDKLADWFFNDFFYNNFNGTAYGEGVLQLKMLPIKI